jgi:hypothetical protein
MNPAVTQPAAAPPDDPVRIALDDPAVWDELLTRAIVGSRRMGREPGRPGRERSPQRR